jgi:hypothetical protein
MNRATVKFIGFSFASWRVKKRCYMGVKKTRISKPIS